MMTRSLTSRLSLSAVACAAFFALTGCSASTQEDVETSEPPAPVETVQQQLIRNGGTGGTATTCVDKWQNCYVGCGVKHPEGDMRDGCEDSCDASYRLCKAYGAGGIGGGIIMY